MISIFIRYISSEYLCLFFIVLINLLQLIISNSYYYGYYYGINDDNIYSLSLIVF